jgi:diamine N-acetyltransferase
MLNQPEPLVNLTSERLMYGPLTFDHLQQASKWANDWAVSSTRGMMLRPYAAETVAAWHERTRTSSDTVHFIIYERDGYRAVGETGFTSIDWFHRSAEYGIVIGETDCWGKGYGTEATRTMIAYGFTHLNLHSIWLRVSSANPAGITAYTRAGFREAGRLREAQLIDGQRHDVRYMECLASEFQAE